MESKLEQIQNLVVKTIATNPAGRGLRLIGGFRLRLLDDSPRLSVDIDYHWEADLEAKAQELITLCDRKILPAVKQRFGLDGKAFLATGPQADSPFVKTVDLSFSKTGLWQSRIEIPLDVTRIPCLDDPIVCTKGGTIYLTVSNQDMLESKVIGLFSRAFVEDRDIVDIFLFDEYLGTDSPERVAAKLTKIGLTGATVSRQLEHFSTMRQQRIRSIEEIIGNQLDAQSAAAIREAGGAAVIFDKVMNILRENLHVVRDSEQ